MINRYNRGFYKFGPLEQANDGELVKYEDHVQVTADIEAAYNRGFRELALNLIDIKLTVYASLTLNVILTILLFAK